MLRSKSDSLITQDKYNYWLPWLSATSKYIYIYVSFNTLEINRMWICELMNRNLPGSISKKCLVFPLLNSISQTQSLTGIEAFWWD